MGEGAVAVCALTVLVGAAAQGTAGFGFALMVAPIFGLVEPRLLPGTVLVLMLPLNAFVVLRERAAADYAGAVYIAMGRLPGTFLGVALLTVASARALGTIAGVGTVAAAAATWAARPFTAGRGALAAVGAVTGIAETATGVGGPPLAMAYMHSTPAALRSSVALSFLVGETMSLATLAWTGILELPSRSTMLPLLLAVTVGCAISRGLVARVAMTSLRRGVLGFSTVSGLVLLLHAVVFS